MTAKDKYRKIALLVFSICLILGVLSACIPYGISLPDTLQDKVTDTAMTITANASDGLGEFNDGYSYVYTDKDLIDKYRSGDANTPYDISIQKVAKTSSNRGAKENPYVIASVEDWDRFAKNLDDGSIPSYGSGKYFVLAKDLDFDGKTFHPVRFFNGTFYGMGSALLNINCANWQYWNGSSYVAIGSTTAGFGVFCVTTGAMITDLIVKNFKYMDMPVTSTVNQALSSTGGMIGLSKGADIILNCHLSGYITSSISYPSVFSLGGLVATHNNTNSDLIIYRCSVDLETKISVSAVPTIGGMVGYVRSCAGTVYIYDSVVNYKSLYSQSSGYAHSSGVIALCESYLNIENVICLFDITMNTSLYDGGFIGIFTTNYDRNFKNCYSDAVKGTNDSDKLSLISIAGNGKRPTFSNINVVKKTSSYATITGCTDFLASVPNELTEYTGATASADMLDAVKDDIRDNTLPSNIWDIEKVGGFAPDTTPVRNYLLAFVNYRNIIDGGSGEESVGIEDGLAYLPNEELASQPSAEYLATKTDKQVFLGWTDDATGESEPFLNLPSGLFGDVTLYAVWGLSEEHVDKYIDTSLTVKDSVSEIIYDSKTSVVLNAKVEYSGSGDGGMVEPEVTYLWKQDGADKLSNKTGVLNAVKVADSGEYTYDYIINDKAQPLWRYKASSGLSESVRVNKGVISLDKFELTNDAYYGRALAELTFNITAKNSAGISVGLASSSWKNTVGQKVIKGENTQNVRVVPVDTDNYESEMILSVKFESKTLYVKFVFVQLAEELKAELEYSQNYGAKEIIYEFNQVYIDALENNPEFSSISDSGMAPYLADEDEYIADPTYRGAPIVEDSSGKALYSGSYNDVRDEVKIYVFFNEVTYTVTFDANSSDNTTTMPEPEAYGYGKFVKQPNDPTNGELLFVGWYFTDRDGEYRPWRFFSETQEDGTVIAQDRVTGTLTLTAEWLSATNLDEVTFTVNPTAKFIALATIDNGSYLTVTAKYSGEKNGITVDSSKTISFGNYVIEYGRMGESGFVNEYKTLKVVEGGMYVRVGVKFGGGTVYSEPQLINVEPIDITQLTEQFNFGDDDGDGVLTFEYDGTGKGVRKLSDQDVLTMTGGQITGITYEYRNSFTNEVVAEPTDIGTYNVTVSYTTASMDFYASPTILTMRIASSIKVRVEWSSTSLMYSGDEQHPTVVKVYNVDTGEEVPINPSQITYSGDTNAIRINIGTHYKVKVNLGDSYKVIDGEECEFDIVKALLEIPKYTAGTIQYDGTTKSLIDYLGEAFDPLLMEIVSGGQGKEVNTYRAMVALKDNINCSWSDGSISAKQVEWKIEPATLYVSWDAWEFVSDGENSYAPKVDGLSGLASGDSFDDYANDFIYKIYDEEGNLLDESEVGEVGSYRVVVSFNGAVKNYTLDTTSKEWYFVVVPKSGMTILTIEWGEKEFLYDGNVHYPTFTVKDSNGADVTEDIKDKLKYSEGYRKEKELGTYAVKITLKDDVSEEYFIRSGATCKYKIVDENGYAPDEDETKPPSGEDPSGDIGSGNEPGGDGSALDELLKKLKEMPLWQLIASFVSIILIIIFMSKGIGYASKVKQSKKMAESKFKTYYAGAFLGLATTYWTVIACVLMGLAVLSLVFMILEKNRYNKALIAFEEARDDYEARKKEEEKEEARRRDEDMKMMFMHMMGGGAGGGQGMPQGVYMGGGIGIDDMRMMINETVTALLPGMQQMLPQQASVNDELIQKLIEKDEKNDETISRLIEQNERLMQDNTRNQETMQSLMQQLAEKSTEKIIEKEVVATTANDETIKALIEGQKAIMQKLAEQPAQQIVQPQIIEKIVEKPVEKIVEVPVEKVIEKEVRVEVPVETVVEKVIEKPIVISTEAVGEAEKSKQVKKTSATKKAPAPRLTLEEAYAKLTKEQKKYFDGLREYAMSKDSKCKEKLSTYFTTIGPSTTNPFIKLTIKKGITVALFKMEDEYLKDIRRNASSDGAKVKIKETEIAVPDKQSYDTAKDMVDLRIDQIDRYNDFLKEQRALRKS